MMRIYLCIISILFPLISQAAGGGWEKNPLVGGDDSKAPGRPRVRTVFTPPNPIEKESDEDKPEEIARPPIMSPAAARGYQEKYTHPCHLFGPGAPDEIEKDYGGFVIVKHRDGSVEITVNGTTTAYNKDLHGESVISWVESEHKRYRSSLRLWPN